MYVGDLKIPDKLVTLLHTGWWPSNDQEALHQNLQCLVSKEAVRNISEDDDMIYFFPPPFFTVAQEREHNKNWDDPMSAPNEICFEKAIDIGDFGLGSDSPILLDYRANSNTPSVIRLKWSAYGKSNHWVKCADNFDEFIHRLGIGNI